MERVFEAFRAIFTDGVARGVEGAELLDGVIRNIDWSGPFSPQTPLMQPVVTAHLAEACALAGNGALGDFARALSDVGDQLHWRDIYQRYAGEPDMDALRANYACTRFCGIGGMVENDTALITVTLQGPRTLYPSHVHKAPEVYVVAAGEAEWQRGDGAWKRKPPGSYFMHPSGVRHATRTLDQPLLCVAVWLGDLDSQVVIVRQ